MGNMTQALNKTSEITIWMGTEGDEKGVFFAEYAADETCLGTGDSPTAALENLFAQYDSLEETIRRVETPNSV